MTVAPEAHDAREVDQSRGWCSLRLRFDERELQLLKGSEQVRGAAYAHIARPDLLRTALTLAKAGRKLGGIVPGRLVSLDEGEVGLLVEALRFASEEVQWASRVPTGASDADGVGARYEAVIGAFPELIEKGLWRSFGLVRELDALAVRLQSALTA